MEQMHRNHKDVQWDWLAVVGDALAGARKPRSSVRARRAPSRVPTRWGRHVGHFG